MDVLLVFVRIALLVLPLTRANLTQSALFSAVLTAFLVLSLPQLSPDPTQQTLDALIVLSGQVGALTSLGSAAPPPYQPVTSSVPEASSVWINVLWLISLTISLFTSVLAMLAKQWLRIFTSKLPTIPVEQARQRHARYMGLLAWNVPAIVESLPVLLHVAVMVFLVGFLMFLWSLSTVL
ncbi:hypothetical protein CALCODRAFT_426443, partial [Calocera cornea HHB12733]